MTVAAMRRGSRMRRGMECASVRASPLACWTALISFLSVRRVIRSSDARLELVDDAFDRLAVGARGEGQCHAVLEDRLRHFEYVVDRGRKPSLDKGACARDQHQRLARTRTRAPRNQLAEVAAVGTGARGAHEIEDRLDYRFADRQSSHQPLCGKQLVRGHGRFWLAFFGASRVEHDFAYILVVWIGDVELHKKTF